MPTTRDTVLSILHRHRADLHDRGVKRLALFGSVLRGEAREDSDVDLLVEFAQTVGLFEFIGLKLYLESILEREVDLVEIGSIKRQLRDDILGEAVDAA